MKKIIDFKNDDCGAVTVDWVVMTAAVTGIGVATMAAVSGGVSDTSSDVSGVLESDIISTSFVSNGSTTIFSGDTTSDYVAYGQSLAPGNNGAVYGWATSAATADAPDGYNFDSPLHDPASNNVIYTSNDGNNYSIGGVVTAVADYEGTAAYFGA